MVQLLFWRYLCSYLAISMAQSIIGDRLLFFAVHFERFTENYPFRFEGLQNILKGMWRAGPQNKGNSPSILFPSTDLHFETGVFKCLASTWIGLELALNL